MTRLGRVAAFAALASLWNPGRVCYGQPDTRAEAYYLYCLGRMYEMQGKFGESLSHYQKAVEQDPEAAFLHLAISELHARAGRADEAVKAARRALEFDPELAGAHRILGSLYLDLARVRKDEALADSAVKELRETLRLESWDVESRQRLAELHLMRGEVDAAASELETLVRDAPDSYYALYRLGQIRREQGDLQRAAELFRQAVEAEPRHLASRVELGRVSTDLGDYAQAVSIYREALEMAPGDSRLRAQLAYALAKGGDLAPAAAEFERVLEEEPESREALLGLALVRRNLREPDVSEALLKKVLQASPDDLQARYSLAGVYQDMREFGKASKELEYLLALPDDAYAAGQRAEFWAELGFARQELEDSSAAIEAFEKAGQLSPDEPRFEAAYVQALLAAEQIERARAACGRALSRFPGDGRLRVLDAQVSFEEGREQAAVDSLLELARREPANELPQRALVALYQRRRQYGEAERFLSEALKSSPSSEGLLFQLGAVLERQKKYDEAEAIFKKALEVNPQSAPTLNYLGYMLADRGVRLKEAFDHVQRAVALDPYNGAYLDSLGWAYFKLGDLALAEEKVLQAIQRLRLTGVVYDHLGDIYFRQGKREAAVQAWKKALEQDDKDLEKRAVARKIERALSDR